MVLVHSPYFAAARFLAATQRFSFDEAARFACSAARMAEAASSTRYAMRGPSPVTGQLPAAAASASRIERSNAR